jgi:hypothetical protein
VVNATIKGAEGRRSTAKTKRPLKGKVARIRVLGREERTNSESAQYHFLLLSLTVASTSSTPLFVNRIWFPKNVQESKRDKTIHLSCEHASQILERLNDSQRRIVDTMLSPAPQDSLVIAHGIVIPLQPLVRHIDVDMITQGLLERGRRPQSLQQQRYGYPVNCRAG